MPGTVVRRTLLTLMWIGIALAVLIVVLLYTPVGVRLGVRFAWSAVGGDSGLSLAIDSVGGSVLRGVELGGARVATPDGTTILSVDRLQARLGSLDPGAQDVVISDVLIEGTDFLLRTDESGRLVGWGALAGTGTDTAGVEADTSGGGWTVGIDARLVDSVIRVEDARSGLELRVAVSDGSLVGNPEDLEASVAGSVSYASDAIERPVSGSFEVEAALSAEYLALTPLVLNSNAGDLTARGRIPLGNSAYDLTIESSHDLARVAAVLGLEDLSGSASLDGRLAGPADGLEYSARVRAGSVEYGRLEISSLETSLSGDLEGLSVSSLAIDGLGGRVTGRGSVRFPTGESSSPAVEADLELDGLSLAEGVELAPDGTALAGRLSGSLTADWDEPGIAGLEASASLRVDGLAVEDRSLGELEFSLSARAGLIRSTGSCCSATIEALCSASEEGLSDCTLTVAAEDLSRIGALFDLEGLSGSARARMAAAGLTDTVSIDFRVDSEELTFRGVEVAPLHAEGERSGGVYEASFSLFDSALTGQGWLEESGDYRATARLDSFDLAAVAGDSLREAMDLAGSADGRLSVKGNLDRGFRAAGELSELALSARGENLVLAAPFEFAVSPDSVSARGLLLETSFGSLSGSFMYESSGAIVAEAMLDSIDLAGALGLLPDPPEYTPSGLVNGSLSISGTRKAPVYVADIEAVGLQMRGVVLDTVSVYVEGDTTDVLFDLSMESASSGTFWAGGSIPVRRDTSGMFAFDPAREFGASVRGESFVLDATEAVLPDVRGDKILAVDGEALLTGRADSLVSINGSGRFDSLRVSLDLVEVVLSDTMMFQIENGQVALDDVTLSVIRKRVLGGRDGGGLTLEGSVDPRGEIDLAIDLAGVDVGHLLRAFAGRGVDVRGSLDAEVSVTGETRNPDVRFSWVMDSPRLYGFGFDSAGGSGVYEGGLLRIERARLVARGDSISVSGTVQTRVPGDRSAESDAPTAADTSGAAFDLSLAAGNFRLERLRSVPAGIERLRGTIDADLAIGGSGGAVDLNGDLTLTDGSLEGFGLAEPVENLTATLRAEGSTIALRDAGADLGSGSIGLSGAVDLSGEGGQTTFYARARLRSPEVVIEETFEGEFEGSLEWGGTPAASTLKGKVVLRDGVVTRSVGLADLVGGGPRVIVVRPERDPRADVQLNIDFDIDDVLEVDSNVADLSLTGGGLIRGTLLEPRISGGVEAEGGTFTYLDNEFSIETLNVSFPNPNRRDPYVSLTGTAEVEDRSGEIYSVTVSVDGYLNDAVPRLASTPPLSEPDIASLLTFGTTFGGFVSGGAQTDSSGDTFTNLARSAFFSSAFGLAESALERLLNLDRVIFEPNDAETGGLAETGVTIGKEFGGKIQVNYSTSVGRFSGQRIEVSLELTDELSLQTRTDPEGDHAIGVKVEIPFR